MRASNIIVAIAIGVAVSGPAYAGKYSCVFLNGSSAMPPCTLESGTSSDLCQQPYPSITGSCLADRISAAADRLFCIYHSPSKSVAELRRDAAKGDTKIATEPGFFAGGLTVGPAAGLLLSAGYQENAAAPLFQVQCVPKH